jgi:hypothetical protein
LEPEPHHAAAGILFFIVRPVIPLFVFVLCGIPVAFDSEALNFQEGNPLFENKKPTIKPVVAFLYLPDH